MELKLLEDKAKVTPAAMSDLLGDGQELYMDLDKVKENPEGLLTTPLGARCSYSTKACHQPDQVSLQSS